MRMLMPASESLVTRVCAMRSDRDGNGDSYNRIENDALLAYRLHGSPSSVLLVGVAGSLQNGSASRFTSFSPRLASRRSLLLYSLSSAVLPFHSIPFFLLASP